MQTSIALTVLAQQGLPQKIIKILRSAGQPMAQAKVVSQLGEGVTQSTVSRAMSVLAASGVIVKTGSTKQALFALSPEAAYWVTPASQRQGVLFDPARISSYEPNVTYWLTDELRAEFALAGGPPLPRLQASTYAQSIAERFLIDLSWASSHLEGNTYSLLDTEVLIKYGEAAEGHDAQETAMILNHKRAIGLLLEQVSESTIEPSMAGKVHSHLMRSLLSPESLGTVRTNEVRISSSAYRPSADRKEVQQSLQQLLWKAEHVTDPYEASFFLCAGLSYLQAFEDGNKRMGRLLGNLPLLRAGLPPLSYMHMPKRNYIQGLLSFYEQGSPDLLAQTLLDSYKITSPNYVASLHQQRIPHRLELRERPWIDAQVRKHLEATMGQNPGPGPAPSRPLTAEEEEWLSGHINEIIGSLSAENAGTWDLPPSLVQDYIASRVVKKPSMG